MKVETPIKRLSFAASHDYKSLCVTVLFGLAALAMGGLTIYQGYTLRHAWLLGHRSSQLFIATTLAAGLLTSCVLIAAAWLACSKHNSAPSESGTVKYFVLLTALYIPFSWVFTASRWGWVLMYPVLPGFVAGIFTKPLDNKLLLLTACCLDTTLIFLSLCIIRDRSRHGILISTMIALALSALTSYACYCLTRV